MLHEVVDFRPFQYSSPSSGITAAKRDSNELVIWSCVVDSDSVRWTNLDEPNVAISVCGDVDDDVFASWWSVVLEEIGKQCTERMGLLESVGYTGRMCGIGLRDNTKLR